METHANLICSKKCLEPKFPKPSVYIITSQWSHDELYLEERSPPFNAPTRRVARRQKSAAGDVSWAERTGRARARAPGVH